MFEWDLGRSALTEYDDNGWLGLQADVFGEDQSGVPTGELHHQFGFQSRPLDPDVDAAGELALGCSVIYAWDGSEKHAWLATDPRIIPLIPQVKKGGSQQYASDGAFANFDPETHTWTLYVPYADGKAHLITVGNDGNNKPIVELSSGTGAAVTILDGTITINNDAGNAYVEINDSGINVVGPFKAAGGADLGGPTSLPLAKFPLLSAALTAIQAEIAAIAKLPPMSLDPSVTGTVTAATTALGVFTAGGATLFTKGA